MKNNKREFFSDIEQILKIKETRNSNIRSVEFIPQKVMKIAKKRNWLEFFEGNKCTNQKEKMKEISKSDQLNFQYIYMIAIRLYIIIIIYNLLTIKIFTIKIILPKTLPKPEMNSHNFFLFIDKKKNKKYF